MRILVAPWGNPTGWSLVTYHFKGKDVESKTSLRALYENIHPNFTFVVALDTLAKIDGDIQGENVLNYKYVVSSVEDQLGVNGKVSQELHLGETKYDLIVLPGVGNFPNGTFKGKITDYYYYLLKVLIFFFVDKLQINTRRIEIHFDATHGINYTPLLTYRAIREIGEVLAIFLDKVRVVVYNSDPFTKISIPEKAHVNVVEDTLVSPKAFGYGADDRVDPLISIDGNNIIPKDLKIEADTINPFIGSIFNGIPLGVFEFYPHINIREYVEKILKLYAKGVKVTLEGSKLLVEKTLALTPTFKVYLFAYLIASLLDKYRLVGNRKHEVSYYEIKNLQKLFNREPYNTRLKRELKSLHDRRVFHRKIPTWILYNKFEGKKIDTPTQRNFIAHSGFERNSFEIRNVGRLEVRFTNCHLERIKEFCSSGLLTHGGGELF